MFIRFIGEYGTPEVREITHCRATTYKYSDDGEKEYGQLVDMKTQNFMRFSENFIRSLCEHLATDLSVARHKFDDRWKYRERSEEDQRARFPYRIRDLYDDYYSDCSVSVICLFDTYKIALDAFNAICAAMASGENFIDISGYQSIEAPDANNC